MHAGNTRLNCPISRAGLADCTSVRWLNQTPFSRIGKLIQYENYVILPGTSW